MRITSPLSPHVTDHGGRVLEHVDVQPVYLGGYWNTAKGRADRTHNDAALKALVKDPGMTGLWKQYGAGAGTTQPSVVASASVNPKTVTSPELEGYLRRELESGALDASNDERVFTFVLPPGCELVGPGGATSRIGMGGFHGSITVGGREVYYAAIAYGQRGNGIDFDGNPRDSLSICESHELTEAVTDPDVMLAMRQGDPSLLGWYDDSSRLGEIGDIPVTLAERSGDRRLTTVWGRSGGFAFQKEWSEKDGRAELAPRRSR